MTFIVSLVHTGSTHGIPGGAGVRRCVADNGGPHECPPQPFWTGVAMAPCLRPFSRRWTHSPYRFMQVPTNADFRSLSDSHVFGTVLHERTLKHKGFRGPKVAFYFLKMWKLAAGGPIRARTIESLHSATEISSIHVDSPRAMPL